MNMFVDDFCHLILDFIIKLIFFFDTRICFFSNGWYFYDSLVNAFEPPLHVMTQIGNEIHSVCLPIERFGPRLEKCWLLLNYLTADQIINFYTLGAYQILKNKTITLNADIQQHHNGIFIYLLFYFRHLMPKSISLDQQ